MKKEQGQVILILLLVMSVALGIGLSVIQRSLTDLSTSSKVEQSSRAFSAAEAGVESALKKTLSSDVSFTIPESELNNNASANVVVRANLPDNNQALEYPPISKEEISHVWLVSPKDLASEQYSGSKLNIYYGNANVASAEKPALELTLVYQDNSNKYQSKKYFFDTEAQRRSTNGFSDVVSGCSHSAITTSLTSTPKTFFCKVEIGVTSADLPSLKNLILLRARLLYTNISQSFAVGPEQNKSLPKQATLITSKGLSGASQRTVQLFQVTNVVPFYFDYSVFASGDINK